MGANKDKERKVEKERKQQLDFLYSLLIEQIQQKYRRIYYFCNNYRKKDGQERKREERQAER